MTQLRMRHGLIVLALAVSLFLLAGCGKKVPVPAPAAVGAAEVGIASWYGQPFHGRQAASGETYDQEKLTAAHRTLPFDTRVRIHNLENSKSVDVRITDRGPFVENRIIDLSRAAARRIGMLGPGTSRVRLEILSPLPAGTFDSYAVQVGAFQIRANAERLRNDMARLHGSAIVVARQGKPVLWRVLVGRISSYEGADALARQLRAEEGESAGQAFVVRLDPP